jgi:hypothetical protein
MLNTILQASGGSLATVLGGDGATAILRGDAGSFPAAAKTSR